MRNVCLFFIMVNNSIDIIIQKIVRDPPKIDSRATLRNADLLIYY